MKFKYNKIIIISCAILLCFALVVGITGAWYNAKRKATGTVVFNDGIFFEFNNVVGEGSNRTLKAVDGSDLSLISVIPNQKVEIENPYILPLENTVDFYLRAKLEYKYYSNDVAKSLEELGKTDVEILSTLFFLNADDMPISFSSKFVKADNGWFYYCQDGSLTVDTSSIETITKSTGNIEFFVNPSLHVSYLFDIEFGSPLEIDKVEISLKLETIQASETGDSLSDFGITPVQSVASTPEPVIIMETGKIFYETTGSVLTITKLESIDSTGLVISNNADFGGNTVKIASEEAFAEFNGKNITIDNGQFLDAFTNFAVNIGFSTYSPNIIVTNTAAQKFGYNNLSELEMALETNMITYELPQEYYDYIGV